MSKNKQKTFLTAYGVVTGVAALGLLWMANSAGNTREEKALAVENRAKEIMTMKNAPIYPKAEFVANMKVKSAQVIAASEKLHAELVKFQLPWDAALDGTQVQGKINTLRDSVLKNAKDRGVKLPENFAFGLDRYLEKAPTRDAAPRLNFVVESLNQTLETILRCGILSVDKFIVPSAKWEAVVETPGTGARPATRTAPKPATTAKADPKAPKEVPPALPEDQVFQRFRIIMQITGSESTVQDALNAITTSGAGQPFYVINSFRMENEKKEGPGKEGLYQPEIIKEEKAADGTTAAAAPADELNVEVKDVRFILGSEKISASVDMDLLLFLSADGEGGVKSQITPTAVVAPAAAAR